MSRRMYEVTHREAGRDYHWRVQEWWSDDNRTFYRLRIDPYIDKVNDPYPREIPYKLTIGWNDERGIAYQAMGSFGRSLICEMNPPVVGLPRNAVRLELLYRGNEKKEKKLTTSGTGYNESNLAMGDERNVICMEGQRWMLSTCMIDRIGLQWEGRLHRWYNGEEWEFLGRTETWDHRSEANLAVLRLFTRHLDTRDGER